MAKPIKFPKSWGRVEFNRAARTAVVDDNPGMLPLLAEELAKRQLSWRRAHPVNQWGRSQLPENLALAEEMLNAGLAGTAGTETISGGLAYAATYRKGDFYNGCGSAIANAMDNWLRSGEGSTQAVWKGGYGRHTRKHGSQQHTHQAAVNLLDAMDGDAENITEDTPEEVNAPALKAEFRAEASGLAAQRTEGQAAERTSHDGGHADDERLDPKDDGEAGYGVDGATRGLNTGRIMTDVRVIAQLAAMALLIEQDRVRLRMVDKAGGLENYIRANREAQRGWLENWHAEVLRQLRLTEVKIMALGEDEILAAVGVQHTDLPRTPYESPPGVQSVRPLILPVETHRAPRARRWKSLWVPVREKGGGAPPSYVGTRVKPGHAWADHKRLMRDWKPGGLLTPGGPAWRQWQKAVRRLAAEGWDRPLIVRRLRSLLDDV